LQNTSKSTVSVVTAAWSFFSIVSECETYQGALSPDILPTAITLLFNHHCCDVSGTISNAHKNTIKKDDNSNKLIQYVVITLFNLSSREEVVSAISSQGDCLH